MTDQNTYQEGELNGLQRAYKLIYTYQQKTGRPEHINACANLLLVIDKEIEKDCQTLNEPEKSVIII